MLKTQKISGATVLTNSKGLTLYWFVPDTSTKSACTDVTCVHYWPPVKGPVKAAAGIKGKIGKITRPDGSAQATFNGHPLYTYIGDSAPGQAKGNGLNLSGGVWHEVTTTTSAIAPAPSKSSSGGGTGGGGGY